MKNKVTSNLFFLVGKSTKYKIPLSKIKRGEKNQWGIQLVYTAFKNIKNFWALKNIKNLILRTSPNSYSE